MRHLLPLLFTFLSFFAAAQNSIVFKEKINKGVYLSFAEFQANRPSVTDSFNVSGNKVFVKGQQVRTFWGLFDGSDFYINYKGINRIAKPGMFSVFETDPGDTMFIDNVYILNYETGDVFRATTKQILNLLSNDPVLYRDFRKNGDAGLVYVYMEKYNVKHPVIYPVITEKDLERIKNDKIKKRINPNGIYLEGLGNAVLFGSVNYERLSFRVKQFYLFSRFGIGYGWTGTRNLVSIPVGINCLYRLNDKVGLEAGIGASLMLEIWRGSINKEYIRNNFDPLLTGYAGVRIQLDEGWYFRGGFCPLVDFKNVDDDRVMSEFFTPWLGISIGYNFRD